MRISDWSSDVCSSDLLVLRLPFGLGAGEQLLGAAGEATEPDRRAAIGAETADALHRDDAVQPRLVARVERVAAAKHLGHAIAVGLRQAVADDDLVRSEEHTSELQSLMRNSDADCCLKKTST